VAPLRNYQELKVWQAGIRLVVVTYALTKRFPKSEVYGLTSQMQRAAVSIPANIAEGYGRIHRGDYLRYLSVANGSLKELETEILIAREMGYVPASQAGEVSRLTDELGRMLGALTRRLCGRPPRPSP
jgi:four helix bundle protein